MDLPALAHVVDAGVVTLTLDVSESGSSLPPATRVFFKDTLARLKGTHEKTAARIRKFVENDLRKETNGLFLAAGESTWHAAEFAVPMRNFVHVGRSPYVAPLLEVDQRSPRALVARVHHREAVLQEVHRGVWRDLDKLEPPAGPARKEGKIVGKSRDRFDQSAERATDAMLRDAAKKLAARAGTPPPAAVFVVGDRECYTTFREHVTPALGERTSYLGPSPRQEPDFARKVAAELDKRHRDRVERELLEFHERRAQAHLVATGARETLEHMTSGRAARVFLACDDPLPGSRCETCGQRYAGEQEKCSFCSGRIAPVSLTHEAVAYALAHPPLAITFVPAPAKWLAEAGGMAALLAEKSAAPKKR
jgi:hypothetical protein